MTSINKGKHGFHVEFDNGYTLSIQWGPMNYCSNRCMDAFTDAEVHSATDFEMAVFMPKGGLIDLSEYDQVQGWVPMKHLPLIMTLIQDGHIDELKLFLADLTEGATAE